MTGYRLHIEGTEAYDAYYRTMADLKAEQRSIARESDYTIAEVEAMSYVVTEDEYRAELAQKKEIEADSRLDEDIRLDELLERIRAEDPQLPAWDDLPTYGPSPRDTSGVWSWDATRQIVGTCSSDVEIVARD